MALIECYECAREISSLAPHCIHCGAPKSDNVDAAEKPQEIAGNIEKKSNLELSAGEPTAKQINKVTDSTSRTSESAQIKQLAKVRSERLINDELEKKTEVSVKKICYGFLLTAVVVVLCLRLAGGGGVSQSPEPTTAKAPSITIHKAPSITIHQAALKGNIEAVKEYLAAGGDVNMRSNVKKTPLHYAAGWGRKDVAELLIANGADVNVKSISGSTPLHDAASEGLKETVELLIAKGADVNAKNMNGNTPLGLAIPLVQPEIADILRKHGGKTGEELKAEGK